MTNLLAQVKENFKFNKITLSKIINTKLYLEKLGFESTHLIVKDKRIILVEPEIANCLAITEAQSYPTYKIAELELVENIEHPSNILTVIAYRDNKIVQYKHIILSDSEYDFGNCKKNLWRNSLTKKPS